MRVSYLIGGVPHTKDMTKAQLRELKVLAEPTNKDTEITYKILKILPN